MLVTGSRGLGVTGRGAALDGTESFEIGLKRIRV